MAEKYHMPRPSTLALSLNPDMAKLQENGQNVFSPMTELAINFQENCKSYSSTPRRRLSLSDIGNTPTPIKAQSKAESVESGIFLDYGDAIDSPTFDDIRARSRKSSVSGNALRKQAVFRRCNSMQAPSSAYEPLVFRLTDDDKSPAKKTNDDEKELNRELNTFGLPDDVKCTSDNSESIMNRSLSAPPILDSLEKYFTDLDGDSKSPMKTDGFDFIEDDQPNNNNNNNVAVPAGLSGLLGGTILSKEFASKKKKSLSRSESENDKENLGPLTDKENIIYENKPLDDRVFEETVFKRPSTLIRKIQKRSVSFSVKRTDSQRDFSPVSSKRIRYRSHSLFNADDQFKSPLLQPHVPSPLRLARSLSVGFPEQSKDDSFVSFAVMEDANLIGDKTKSCCLPVIEKRQHQDLKAITPETLSAVLSCEYKDTLDEAIIVDCRYPYEYNGGHIKGAINIYTKEDTIEHFLKKPISKKDKRIAIIFHCEFSSKRGPSLSRFLRNKDRDIHKNCYPRLYYPELYYLEGGYKAFFTKYKELCEPQEYLKMVDEKYANDLKHFTKRSKSWSEGNSRMRTGLRY